MKWVSTASLVLVAALTQAVASEAAKDADQSGAKKPETSIPFVDLQTSVITWQADGEQGLWIQDARKQWYYAQTFGRCDGLEFAATLGFRNRTLNTLDKYSEIIVPNSATGRCALKSFTKSEQPPEDKHYHKKSATPDKK